MFYDKFKREFDDDVVRDFAKHNLEVCSAKKKLIDTQRTICRLKCAASALTRLGEFYKENLVNHKEKMKEKLNPELIVIKRRFLDAMNDSYSKDGFSEIFSERALNERDERKKAYKAAKREEAYKTYVRLKAERKEAEREEAEREEAERIKKQRSRAR